MTSVSELTFEECIQEATRFDALSDHKSALACLESAREITKQQTEIELVDTKIKEMQDKLKSSEERRGQTLTQTQTQALPQTQTQTQEQQQPQPPPQQPRGFDYILPEYKMPLFFLGIAIVAAIIYRFFFNRSDAFFFGNLPGDFYYRTETTFVYFPMVSWIIFSLGMSAIVNLLNYFANRN